MSVIQVGLVDTTGQLDAKLVQAAAAALNVQVIRDLPQFWSVTATVRYLPDPKQIPVGVWPVFLVAQLPPGEGGVHLDKKNQPYALVIGTPTSADWTLDASHETLEMLVDPAGNRLQASRAIEIVGNDVRDATGQFEYLVEACDPCEGSQYAYTIQGVAVSDFITPRFYDPVATPSARYSYAGHIQRPRQILPGGYISFTNPASDSLQQIQFLGPKPILKNLGPANGKPLRVLADSGSYWDVRAYRHHKQRGAKYRKSSAKLAKWCVAHRKIVDAAAITRGSAYRQLNRR